MTAKPQPLYVLLSEEHTLVQGQVILLWQFLTLFCIRFFELVPIRLKFTILGNQPVKSSTFS